MNFNYSYRAFLITSLLFASLFLGMQSIKLSRYKVEIEDRLDVEYVLEEISPEEETINDLEKSKIETNQAYNEAERYITEIENNRSQSEITEAKLQAMNDALLNTSTHSDLSHIKNAEKKIDMARQNVKSKNEHFQENSKSSNKNTTISYSLVNRKALLIPNPVYTCSSSGKVVISIEVNSIGKVIKASYNRAASTTSNVCLIDAAIQYASQARFSNDKNRVSQIGTITYNYPGQI